MSGAVRGCFVSGTDTGVGKSLVATTLIGALRAGGLDVGVQKPIETGVGALGPADAIALRDAAGSDDPLEDVCPQHFALPAAPTVVAEGAGGLLVPAAEGCTMADLARRLGLPLVIVARAALGTINHTALTLEAAAARGLDVLGVVISHADGALSGPDAENLTALRAALGRRLIGEIPPLGPAATAPTDAIDVAPVLTQKPYAA